MCVMSLQTLQCDLQSVESRIANFRKDSEKYSSMDGGTEMQKYISELEDMYEDVAEALKHRMAELENELERTENYSSYYEVFMPYCTVVDHALYLWSLTLVHS